MKEYLPLIKQLAEALSIDWALLAGQVEQESSWDPTAVGDDGTAFGLGQIHLNTARQFHPFWTAAQLFVPHLNLFCMYDFWRWALAWLDNDVDHVLIAYNWGPGNLLTYLRGQAPLPTPVQSYIDKVHERAERIRHDNP